MVVDDVGIQANDSDIVRMQDSWVWCIHKYTTNEPISKISPGNKDEYNNGKGSKGWIRPLLTFKLSWCIPNFCNYVM